MMKNINVNNKEYLGKKDIFKLLFIAAMAVGLVLIILFHIFRLSCVNGLSNYPTMNNGDTVVSKYGNDDIKRNDFVTAHIESLNLDVIKRVVGIPGDHIQISFDKVYVNGVEETAVTGFGYTKEIDIIVPEDSYFIMGDNRSDSVDSRNFGCVNKDDIIGVVLFWY